MVITEFYAKRDDGVNLYRSFSDAGYKIKQSHSGKIYNDAIDVETSLFNYEETDEKIDKEI